MLIDDEQVEAAARAIREVHCARIWAASAVCGPPTPWENLKEERRECYREEARAALIAAVSSAVSPS